MNNNHWSRGQSALEYIAIVVGLVALAFAGFKMLSIGHSNQQQHTPTVSHISIPASG